MARFLPPIPPHAVVQTPRTRSGYPSLDRAVDDPDVVQFFMDAPPEHPVREPEDAWGRILYLHGKGLVVTVVALMTRYAECVVLRGGMGDNPEELPPSPGRVIRVAIDDLVRADEIGLGVPAPPPPLNPKG
ncbi:hypothetical protein Br6_05027 [Rhodococcus sp. Br-6]|nr:hypothetical protein Br6_05027 [Rhodococcus sp. Br-6]